MLKLGSTNNIFIMKRKNRGFTLIELLVVISIIGVLSSITLVSVQAVKDKAKETKNFVEVRELMKAMELYKLDNNSYPGNFDTYYVSSQNPAYPRGCDAGLGTDWTSVFDANFMSKYMSKLPTESQPCGIIYVKFSSDNSGNPSLTCNISATNQTGYKNSEYEYFLIMQTDGGGIYRDLGWVTWQYSGAMGAPVTLTGQKCLPGPHK